MPIAAEVSIYIKRDDLIMGPFSESQTVKRYHRGEFRDTDLAMIDGMTGWHPLATYIVDDGESAPSIFDASAPPPIPQHEPPPRFEIDDGPHDEPYDEALDAPREEPLLDERRSRLEFANPVGAAWALLGLGVVVMVLSRWPFLLWVPLILAAIGLAVQQLVRRNYVHAGPLLAVALLAPWFVWSQWLSPAMPHPAKATTVVVPVAATPARVIVQPSLPPESPKVVVADKPDPNAAPPAPAPEPKPEPPELVSSPAAKFAPGEFVVLIADTKLRFEGKEFRLGKAGERFEVLAAAPDRIHLKARTARGQVIAITAPPEQLKTAPPLPATPVRPHIIE